MAASQRTSTKHIPIVTGGGKPPRAPQVEADQAVQLASDPEAGSKFRKINTGVTSDRSRRIQFMEATQKSYDSRNESSRNDARTIVHPNAAKAVTNKCPIIKGGNDRALHPPLLEAKENIADATTSPLEPGQESVRRRIVRLRHLNIIRYRSQSVVKYKPLSTTSRYVRRANRDLRARRIQVEVSRPKSILRTGSIHGSARRQSVQTSISRDSITKPLSARGGDDRAVPAQHLMLKEAVKELTTPSVTSRERIVRSRLARRQLTHPYISRDLIAPGSIYGSARRQLVHPHTSRASITEPVSVRGGANRAVRARNLMLKEAVREMTVPSVSTPLVTSRKRTVRRRLVRKRLVRKQCDRQRLVRERLVQRRHETFPTVRYKRLSTESSYLRPAHELNESAGKRLQAQGQWWMRRNDQVAGRDDLWDALQGTLRQQSQSTAPVDGTSLVDSTLPNDLVGHAGELYGLPASQPGSGAVSTSDDDASLVSDDRFGQDPKVKRFVPRKAHSNEAKEDVQVPPLDGYKAFPVP